MFRPKALLAAAATLIGVSAANADYLTEQAILQRNLVNAGQSAIGPVPGFVRLDVQGGAGYTNGYDSAAPAVGAHAISVFAGPAATLRDSSGAIINPAFLTGGNNINNLNAIAVVNATITGVAGPLVSVQNTVGKLYLVPTSTGFNSGNPATWGNLANAVAVTT